MMVTLALLDQIVIAGDAQMIDFEKIRHHSLKMAKKLGYRTNPTLPLLESPVRVRGKDEIIGRMLGMHGVAAAAFGFPKERVLNWIVKEVGTETITDSEANFLRSNKAIDPYQFISQVEGIWALAWITGLVSSLDFGHPCGKELPHILPNLKHDETSNAVREKAVIRPLHEIVGTCDLAYCLHWAIVDARLRGRKPPGKLEPDVIVERRHALEWVISEEEWGNVPMDT